MKVVVVVGETSLMNKKAPITAPGVRAADL